MHSQFKHLLILLFLFCSSCMYGQLNKVEKLSSKEGLTNNFAHFTQGIYKDTFGYVWITSYAGLNRYDGYEITRYNKVSPATHDLPIKRLTTITGDQFGNLWLGTDFNDVIKYNSKQESFSLLSEIVESESFPKLGTVNGLHFDSLSNLSISTFGNGQYIFNPKTSAFGRKGSYQEGNQNPIIGFEEELNNGEFIYFGSGLFQFEEGEFKQLADHKSYYTTFLVELPNHKLYYELYNSQERIIHDLNTHQEMIFDPEEDISSYFIQGDEGYTLWGIKINTPPIFNYGKLDLVKTLNCDSINHNFFDMQYDLSGDIVYASAFNGAGVINQKENIFNKFNVQLYALKKIKDEIYLSTYKAIQTFNGDSLWLRNAEDKSLNPSMAAWNFCLDKDSNLMTSNVGKRYSTSVYSSDGELMEAPFNSTLHDQMELFLDGNVVVDSRQNVTKKSERIKFVGEYYEALSKQAYPEFRVRYFYQSSNEDIWMATLNGQLIRVFDNYKQYEFVKPDEFGNGKLRNTKIYYIYEAYGKVYFCNEMGIDVFDLKTEEFGNLELHIGTTPFYVKGMTHDDQGNLWLMDNDILFRYNLDHQSLNKFYVPDDYKVRVNPCKDLIFHENTIFYKGLDFIGFLNVEKLKTLRTPENVIFQDLFVDRKKIYPSDNSAILDSSLLYQAQFKLNYNQRNVGFKFVSVDSKELNAEYFYRLIGLSDQWINIGEDRIIHFTNLSPGDYSFEVKVRASSGSWSNQNSVRNFKVYAPWYASWWAYLIYATLVAAMLYVLYTLQMNKLREKEKINLLRNKISHDLHDDVGSILTGMAMQSEVIAFGKEGDEKESLNDIANMSRQATERMRDIVWAMDSSKDKFQNLVDRMNDVAISTLQPLGIKFIFNNNSINLSNFIAPNKRKEIHLIFKEALTNVTKHSDASLVTISFHKIQDKIELTIKDNGTLSTKKESDGVGLSNMRRRAESIGGELRIEKGDGFLVRVLFDADE